MSATSQKELPKEVIALERALREDPSYQPTNRALWRAVRRALPHEPRAAQAHYYRHLKRVRDRRAGGAGAAGGGAGLRDPGAPGAAGAAGGAGPDPALAAAALQRLAQSGPVARQAVHEALEAVQRLRKAKRSDQIAPALAPPEALRKTFYDAFTRRGEKHKHRLGAGAIGEDGVSRYLQKLGLGSITGLARRDPRRPWRSKGLWRDHEGKVHEHKEKRELSLEERIAKRLASPAYQAVVQKRLQDLQKEHRIALETADLTTGKEHDLWQARAERAAENIARIRSGESLRTAMQGASAGFTKAMDRFHQQRRDERERERQDKFDRTETGMRYNLLRELLDSRDSGEVPSFRIGNIQFDNLVDMNATAKRANDYYKGYQDEAQQANSEGRQSDFNHYLEQMKLIENFNKAYKKAYRQYLASPSNVDLTEPDEGIGVREFLTRPEGGQEEVVDAAPREEAPPGSHAEGMDARENIQPISEEERRRVEGIIENLRQELGETEQRASDVGADKQAWLRRADELRREIRMLRATLNIGRPEPIEGSESEQSDNSNDFRIRPTLIEPTSEAPSDFYGPQSEATDDLQERRDNLDSGMEVLNRERLQQRQAALQTALQAVNRDASERAGLLYRLGNQKRQLKADAPTNEYAAEALPMVRERIANVRNKQLVAQAASAELQARIAELEAMKLEDRLAHSQRERSRLFVEDRLGHERRTYNKYFGEDQNALGAADEASREQPEAEADQSAADNPGDSTDAGGDAQNSEAASVSDVGDDAAGAAPAGGGAEPAAEADVQDSEASSSDSGSDSGSADAGSAASDVSDADWQGEEEEEASEGMKRFIEPDAEDQGEEEDSLETVEEEPEKTAGGDEAPVEAPENTVIATGPRAPRVRLVYDLADGRLPEATGLPDDDPRVQAVQKQAQEGAEISENLRNKDYNNIIKATQVYEKFAEFQRNPDDGFEAAEALLEHPLYFDDRIAANNATRFDRIFDALQNWGEQAEGDALKRMCSKVAELYDKAAKQLTTGKTVESIQLAAMVLNQQVQLAAGDAEILAMIPRFKKAADAPHTFGLDERAACAVAALMRHLPPHYKALVKHRGLPTNDDMFHLENFIQSYQSHPELLIAGRKRAFAERAQRARDARALTRERENGEDPGRIDDLGEELEYDPADTRDANHRLIDRTVKPTERHMARDDAEDEEDDHEWLAENNRRRRRAEANARKAKKDPAHAHRVHVPEEITVPDFAIPIHSRRQTRRVEEIMMEAADQQIQDALKEGMPRDEIVAALRKNDFSERQILTLLARNGVRR